MSAMELKADTHVRGHERGIDKIERPWEVYNDAWGVPQEEVAAAQAERAARLGGIQSANGGQDSGAFIHPVYRGETNDGINLMTDSGERIPVDNTPHNEPQNSAMPVAQQGTQINQAEVKPVADSNSEKSDNAQPEKSTTEQAQEIAGRALESGVAVGDVSDNSDKTLLDKAGEALDNFADKVQEVGKDIAVGAGEVAGEHVQTAQDNQQDKNGSGSVNDNQTKQPENKQNEEEKSEYEIIKPEPIRNSKGKVYAWKFQGFGAGIDKSLEEASKKYGIDIKTLRGFLHMEDGWYGSDSNTGAIGPGQFTFDTWNDLAKTKEGKEIGMKPITRNKDGSGNFRKADDPRRDPHINVMATALFARNNAEKLKAAGVPVTSETLYMVHNIGSGVIPALQGSDKVNKATLDSMDKNRRRPNETPTQFVKRQMSILSSHYKIANDWYENQKNQKKE